MNNWVLLFLNGALTTGIWAGLINGGVWAAVKKSWSLGLIFFIGSVIVGGLTGVYGIVPGTLISIFYAFRHARHLDKEVRPKLKDDKLSEQ